MIHLLGLALRDRSSHRDSVWTRIAASAVRVIATFALAVTMVVPVGSAPALATTHCPVGSIDWLGADGNWSDASNWSSDPALPTATDDVCIPVGVTVTVDVNAFARQLASSGTLDVQNNVTLDLSGPSDTSGLILAGTIDGTGWLSLTGSGEWTKGTIATDVEVTTTGTLTILGTASAEIKNVTGRLVNSGDVDQVGTRLYSIASGGDSGTITNNGRWYLSHPTTGFGAIRGQATSNPGTFINNGLLERRNGSGEVEFTSSVNLENYGTVSATSGILKVTATTEIGGGMLSADSGATLRLRGRAATGATVTGSSAIAGTGIVEWYGDTFNFSPGSVVDVQGGFELDGAEIAGTGSLRISGTGTWVEGTVSGNVEVASAGTLTIGGAVTEAKTLTGTLTNGGTVVQATPGLYVSTASATGEIINNGLWQLTNFGNNFFTIRGDAGNPGLFTNNDTLERTGAENPTRTSSLTTGVELDNNGVVTASNGRLQIDLAPDHYAGTVFAGGRWEAHGGSTIDLPGTITVNSAYLMLSGDGSSIADINGTGPDAFVRSNGTFRLDESADFTTQGDFANGGTLLLGNAGAVSDASTLTVTGAFTNDVTGTVRIQIASVEPAHLYGEIVSTGSASLDGTLEAELLGGFIPTIGDVYQVMSYPSRTGTFGTVLADPYLATTVTGDATTPGGVFFTGVNQRPIADAGASDYNVDEGDPGVQLNGSGSFDPDGAIVSYEWQTAAWFTDNTASQPMFTNTDDDADHAVSLTVCDDGIPQECETDNTTVHVNNVDPQVVALIGTVNLSEGDTLPVTDLASFGDAGTLDTHSSQIAWGDGNTDPVVDPDTSPVSGGHTYLASGSYTMTVDVWDDDGGHDSVDVPVVIANVAPTVTPGTPGLTEGDGTTTVVLATVTDPGTESFTATVDWGDGSALDTGVTVNGSGQVTGRHSYADNGAYGGRVCVSDDTVEVCEDVTITVLNADPTLTITTPVINGTVGTAVSVNGTYGDDGVADTHTADIDWDDATSALGVAVTGNPFSLGHTYTSEGTYTVQLCIVDDDLGRTCGTADINISPIANDPPIVEAGGDYFGDEGSSIPLDGTVTDPDGNLASTMWTSTGGSFDDPQVVDTRFTALQDGTYTITLTGTDDLGASTDDQATVTVRNVGPSIILRTFEGNLAEGSTVTMNGGFSDPGVLDVHTASVEWSSGAGFEPAIVDQDANTLSASHIYLDNVSFVEVDLCVSDGTAQQCNATHIDIVNVAPSIDTLNVDTALPEGSTISLAAVFSDPGILDTHSATIDWGEGAGAGAASLSGSSLTGSNLYEQDGTYTVEVCVTDDDGGTTCATADTTVTNVAPTIETLNVDTALPEGSTISLAAVFSDPGNLDTHSATVDWGEGAGAGAASLSGSSVTGSNLYEQDGTYTVEVCITDDDTTSCRSTDITIANVAPTVDAGPDATIDAGGTVDLAAGFSDPGADTWTATIDWGDGSGLQLASVDAATMAVSGQHTYAAAGSYIVEVCVSDGDVAGCDQFDVLVEAIAGTPPTADPGGPYAGDEGTPIALDGSASSDDGTIAGYLWTSNGGSFDDPTLAAPTFTAPDNGTFTVTIEVTDDEGLTAASTTTVTVDNVVPSVNAGDPEPAIRASGSRSLSATFTDPGADTHTATIEWGDGTPPTVIDPASSPIDLSHSYVKPGTYTIMVTVVDDDGGSDSDTVEVTVAAELGAPSADAGGPYRGIEGSRIRLDGSRSSDEDGTIVSYRWTSDQGLFDRPNSRRPRFTAPDNGTYTVTLEVTDNDGLTDTTSTAVEVANAEPRVDAGRNATILSGERYRLLATFTDAGTADTHSATIDWGDSTVTIIDSAISPLALDHLYDKAGRYTVRVTVVDDEGGRDQDTVRVTVKGDKADKRKKFKDFILDLLERLRERLRGRGRWWR